MCKTSLADDGVLWFCLSSDLSPWLFFQLVEEAVPALAADCVPYFLRVPTGVFWHSSRPNAPILFPGQLPGSQGFAILVPSCPSAGLAG